MKSFLVLTLCIFALSQAKPNLVAPASVRLLSSAHPLWDTVEVTTYLQNTGDSTAWSPLYPSTYTAVITRIDSLWSVGSHSIAYLLPGYFLPFKDTTIVMKAPFALTTWTNPLFSFGEGGGEVFNNVLSWTYNFHPEIVYDTVYVIQTDTLRDTNTIVIHDTVIVYDTLKTNSAKPLAKAAQRHEIEGKIYNIMGQLVWRGKSMEGEIPHIRLSQGVHILIQENKRKYLKVIAR